MFYLVALHAIIFMTLATSLMGGLAILKGLKIFELQKNVRNFMYAGACCALCLGALGAATCAGLLSDNVWHPVTTTLLVTVSLVALTHICLDLSERLSLLNRN